MGPQTLIIQFVLLVRTGGPRMIRFARRIGWWKVGGGALVVAVLIAVVFFITRDSKAELTPHTGIRSVELKSVAELSSQTSPLSVVGQVTSKSEATVRTEHSGQIVAVYKALGDTISAGAVAAEIENASERAAVLQAEGAVEAAQANLSKVTGGARSEQLSILESNLANASASLLAAHSGALNALLSAYATGDNAIHGTDKMFTNPNSNSLVFNVLSSDSQLTMKIENTRPTIGQYLAREEWLSGSLSASSNLASEITTTEAEIRAMRSFLDMIISALNKGIPSSYASETTISAYLGQATAARTTLTTALSSLSGATQGLVSAESMVEVARKNLEQGVTGGQSEDVAAAQAAVKQAQGGLAAARANVAKTIIRAPLSGTINSFSLKRGDYVQMATPVLTVANNGALEVVAYITESDAREIALGQSVMIDEATGVVTTIAPALDPLTKKIEVRIGINNAKDIVNGQSVLAEIMRTDVETKTQSRITIPLSALKIGTEAAAVFSVGSDSTLISHPVILGALLGDRVVITDGLTLDMHIVTDARGLREGEKVEVSAQGGFSSGGK